MALSRRSFLGVAAAGVGSAALGLTALRRTGRVHEVALTARPADWDIGNAGAAPAWTYNGVVPGPELRVTAGDTLRVVLTNELPEPTTIH